MLKNRQIILFFGDVAVLILSFLLMLTLRFQEKWADAFWTHRGPFTMLFLVWLLLFFIFDLYDIRKVNPNPRNIGQLALVMGCNLAVGVLLFYIFPYFGITPKVTLLIVGISAFGLLVVWRRLFYKIFTSTFRQSIVLIGESEAMTTFQKEMEGNDAIGHVTATWKSLKDGEEIVLSPRTMLIAEAHTPKDLLLAAKKFKSGVMTLSDAYEELLGKSPVSLMTPERAMHILSKHESIGYSILRRFVDILFATGILIITSPFLLLAALAIKIEDGRRVFYSHLRTGLYGKQFRIYKLQSMKENAERSGAVWAEEQDPRITKIGRLLRKTHIDEIPQMWNILRGDISFVGPRPERPEFVEKLEEEIPYYFLRHSVKPGFTGWGQIKFRYARTVLDSREKFEYDLYYIIQRNFLLDLGIITKTIQIIFTH